MSYRHYLSLYVPGVGFSLRKCRNCLATKDTLSVRVSEGAVRVKSMSPFSDMVKSAKSQWSFERCIYQRLLAKVKLIYDKILLATFM